MGEASLGLVVHGVVGIFGERPPTLQPAAAGPRRDWEERGAETELGDGGEGGRGRCVWRQVGEGIFQIPRPVVVLGGKPIIPVIPFTEAGEPAECCLDRRARFLSGTRQGLASWCCGLGHVCLFWCWRWCRQVCMLVWEEEEREGRS